jgi:uncharacterized protein (DUF58 family)
LLRQLDAIRPGGPTNLARAIDQVVRRCPRPGLLALLSDFFDPGPGLAARHRAASAGHDVVLLQVVAPEEVEPSLEGDLTLEDAEGGPAVDVTIDAAALEAYGLRFAGLCEELRCWARRHGSSYVRVRTDDGLEAAVRRIVARSVD